MNGLPSFYDLANMAKPTMMPKANSPVSGMMYGQDMGRQDQFLQRAAMAAQLQARMAAMDAEEKSAGHEGRMAETRVKSATAMDDEAQLPAILAGRRSKRDADTAKSNTNKIQEEIEGIAPWIDSWSKASPEDKGMIQEMMREQGVTIGSRKLGDMKPQDLDRAMTLFRVARENSPKLTGIQMQQAGANTRKEMELKSKERLDGLKAQLRLKIEKDKRDNKKLTLNQYVTEILQNAVENGDMTPKQVVEYQRDLMTYGEEVDIAKAPGVASIEGGQVVRKKPVAPTKPSVPNITAKETPEKKKPIDNLTKGKVYKNAEGKRAEYLGDGKWKILDK